MKTNTKRATIHTHEGATAQHINAELRLRRSVMACMLWEDEFYESGETIAKRTPKHSKPIVCCRSALSLPHVSYHSGKTS